MAEILRDLPAQEDSNLLIGAETSDDAGVYRLTPDIALIQTLDFFTPIVNDPYDFGRIAAANAFSDIYAMGGRPLTAMNIVCFPIKDMDKSILRSILKGGFDAVRNAGALLLGGHSLEDPELKYGLSVTGLVHPDHVLTNADARPGDRLILTKPVGTGILATALKARMLDDKISRMVADLMAALNRDASEAMLEVGVNAVTDITGFGLTGHCLEMAQASHVGMRLFANRVPVIPEAVTFAGMGIVPEGTHKNRKFCSCSMEIDPEVDPILVDVMADAQTSGGLLISVPREKSDTLITLLQKKKTPCASIVGEVTSAHPGQIRIVTA